LTEAGRSERLPLDVRATRAARRLRTVAALVVIPAAAAVAWDGGAVRWTLAVLAWLAALAWIGRAAVARRTERDAEHHYLELGAEGLALCRGADPLLVPWSTVSRVEVDEESLTVRVERGGEPPLALEPIWGGLGVYDLCERVERAWGGARRTEAG